MYFLNNKKAFLGLVGLLLVVSFLAYTGNTNTVVAEGGNQNQLPVVSLNGSASLLADTIYFSETSPWKYFDKGTVPGTGWYQVGFNDGSWASGSGPLGYGEASQRTEVKYGSDSSHKYITTYFRKTFSIADVSKVSTLYMDLAIDDGAVIYINGKKVGSVNMTTTGTISNSTLASSCLLKTTMKTLPQAYLVTGVNTLAVEVHQCSASSSDLLFSMALHGDGSVVEGNPTAVPTQPVSTAAPTKPVSTVVPVIPTATSQAPVTPTSVATIPPTTGHSYYVTTSGSSSGDGSASRPWSLSAALSQPSALRGGDTVWVRGGTYSGAFTSRLKGSSSAPITIRAYPGERVILKNSSSPVLDIYDNSYVNFWGLEITSSYSTRSTSRSESTYGLRVNQGVSSDHVKFINMIVHDVQSQGIGYWQALTDSEIYGSLFYYNGTTQLDHGVYVHNVSGTKTIANNFIYDNAGHGLHGYAETADKGLTNIRLDGNTIFNNGSIGYTTSKSAYGIYKRNILMGGLTKTYNGVISNNNTYYPGSTGEALNLGYNAGSSGAKVTNNYFAGGAVELGGGASSLTMTGNTVFAPGGFIGFSTSSYSNNTWTKTKPSALKIFVRPNSYEPNRAHVTIYNWGKQSSVSISSADLGGISLKAGDSYELRNVQNYFSDIVKGVYNGSSISVPMTGHSVAQPVGLSFKPASTFPEFGAFVLIVAK